MKFIHEAIPQRPGLVTNVPKIRWLMKLNLVVDQTADMVAAFRRNRGVNSETVGRKKSSWIPFIEWSSGATVLEAGCPGIGNRGNRNSDHRCVDQD
jgi:hypothetical protein